MEGVETSQSLPTAPIQHTVDMTSMEHSASLVVNLDSQAEVVRFWHATFGSPAISKFHTALRKVLMTIPGMTPKMTRKYAPNSDVTSLAISIKQGKVSNPPDALRRFTA